jgi:hypothetical protein
MGKGANDMLMKYLINDNAPTLTLLIILTCALIFIIQNLVRFLTKIGKNLKSKVLNSNLVQGKHFILLNSTIKLKT